MKTIKYISFILICLSLFGNITAQDIETYRLEMPEIIFENGGPIHVLPLIDNSEEEIVNHISENFKTEVSNGLQAKGLAYKHNLPSFNPWMQTNLYNTTENLEEATYIISGDYSLSTSHVKSYNEKSKATESDSLPFVYFEFTEKSTATVIGNVIITESKTNNEVAKIPYSKEVIDEDKKIMEHADAKSPQSLIPSVSDYFINEFRYKFSAVKTAYEYNFPKIKPADKQLKKEFREYKRTLKDLADQGNLNEMYKLYSKIQQIEDSPEVNEAIGICYEILGNYTKAKEYYNNCENTQRRIQLDQQISIQTKLKDLGIQIEEPEF